MVLDEKTLCPVSILIHSGTPNDSKLFEPTLKELKRRRIIKNKDIILFDRGYYSYKNYEIGVNEYGIVPVIFPKSTFKMERLDGRLSYPIDVFDKKSDIHENKKLFKEIKCILLDKLTNWEDLKPIRGIIEDFFKVAKSVHLV